VKQIQLTQNQVALVDDNIYEAVSHLKWYAIKTYGIWYAARHSSRTEDAQHKQRVILLHWLVIGKPPKGMMVDHIDGDGLNNQRSNLRFATNRVNQRNQIGHRNGRLAGATFHKGTKKWQAQVLINGKKKYLGIFDTEWEAHEAYKQAVKELKI
jgi:hypothetical protein